MKTQATQTGASKRIHPVPEPGHARKAAPPAHDPAPDILAGIGLSAGGPVAQAILAALVLLEQNSAGSRSEALARLQDLDRRGHAEGTLLLARCMLVGQGIDADPARAVELIELVICDAADRPLVLAMAHNLMGDAYRMGLGVCQDHASALDCYMRASMHGVHGALYHLGLWYARCSPNWAAPRAQPDIAAFYYSQGADAGCTRCLCELAQLHLGGQLRPSDQLTGLRLLQTAAARGNRGAASLLAFYVAVVGAQALDASHGAPALKLSRVVTQSVACSH